MPERQTCECVVCVAWFLAWENSRHFETPPLVSRYNDVRETSADIPYWRRFTTQFWVVLLIGWSRFPTRHDQSSEKRAQTSLVPRPVRAVRVTRGGLEPSAIARGVLGEFSRQAWQVTSHPKSPRTTGNDAVFARRPRRISRQAWQVTSHPKSPRTTGNEAERRRHFAGKPVMASRNVGCFLRLRDTWTCLG